MKLILLYLLCLLCIAYAQRTQITVISDTHLGSAWLSSPERISMLKTFLTQFTLPSTKTHTLVIAGDLLENWLDPFSTEPLTLAQTLNSTNLYNASIPEFFNILKNITDNQVSLVYTIGNHDDFMTKDAFTQFNIPVTFTDAYIKGNMRIEHGHYYDVFNAPDPVGIRSLGYYIARAAATSGRSSTTSSLTKQLCQTVLGNTFTVDVLRYDALGVWNIFFTSALSAPVEKFKSTQVSKGCFYSANEKTYPFLGTAIWKYKTLLDRLIKQRGTSEYVANMIDAACSDYSYFIKRMNHDLVILGHTHTPGLKAYSRAAGSIVYVNSGAWTTDLVNPTYVTITTDTSSGNARFVELYNYYNSSYSYLVSSSAIGNTVQPPAQPPREWTCATSIYGAGDKCDCNCGAVDPDCSNTALAVTGCLTMPNTQTTCAGSGLCQYTTRLPGSWKCDKSSFATFQRCECNCGSFDPSCSFNSLSIKNCGDGAVGCNYDGVCIYSSNYTLVPATWTCPREYYGTSDGCDCDCGTADPDCKGDNTCGCIGTQNEATQVVATTMTMLVMVISVIMMIL